MITLEGVYRRFWLRSKGTGTSSRLYF